MKKDTYKNKKDNSHKWDKGNSSATSSDINDLLRQLEIFNISIDTVFVILLGGILNIYNIYIKKLKVLDQINNTNIADNVVEIKDLYKIIFAIFLYASATFLEINYNEYIYYKN